jgi:hypothetical protein
MRKVWIGILVIIIVAFSFAALMLYSGLRAPSKEDIIATELLNDVLYEKYVPSHVEMVNRLTYMNQTAGMESLYGSIWYVDNEKFYTSVLYNDLNESGISNLKIFIFAQDVSSDLDEESASLLFSRYFKISGRGETVCNYTVPNVIWCENFWEDENKTGMFAVSTPETKFVGLCEYPIGSAEYEFPSCSH